MRKFFLGAFTLLMLLSGCSKNKLVEGDNGVQNDGKIRFAATTNRPSNRAASDNPITTAELQSKIGEFNVSGYTGTETTTLVNDVVSWTGSSWEYTNEPYWPNAAMNFFAYANWGQTPPTIANTGITANDVTIAEDKMDATGQKDLLVATLKDATKEVRTTLTFKHALTQIIFKAGNLDAQKLQVRIGGMRIVNVSNKGDMAATATATGTQIAWADNTTTQTTKYVVQGLQVVDAAFAPAAASAAFTVAAVNPTDTYSTYKQIQTAATGNNALMLIPQTFTAWNPNDVEKPATTAKAYIELLAIINHPAKVSTDAAVGDANYYYCGTPVIGANGTADTYGKIYIPIESKSNDMNEWVAGKRISYIITFGDTGSGSGGGGYDEDNDPILVPIKFKATVENWVDVDVPLLTASFNATSQDIKASFIDGFTNQLLNDIAGAKEVKTYRANIKISGLLNTAAIITFNDAQNAKIATGSTVTYDFTGITGWSAQTIKMTVPTGWKAASYLNALTTAVSEVAAAAEISVEGTTANKIVLTKIQ